MRPRLPAETDAVRLDVSPEVLALQQHQAADFTAIGFTTTGDTAAVAITWSVTKGSIVDTSTSNGRHRGRYRAGADTGTVRIVAKGHPGDASDTAVVTVTLAPVATVTVSPATASVAIAQTVQLTATPLETNGSPLTGRTVTWATSNAAVATVSGNGLVTGVAAGSANITATSEGQNGTATITVSLVPVAAVTVSPASASVLEGQTVQLTATPKDASGNPLTGRVVTWASNAPGVATVSASGVVTGVVAGSATITATSETQTGTAAITVSVVVPVASVAVTPPSSTLRVGATVQLTATTKDAAGNVLTGRSISWSSNTPAVATVSPSGLVSAVVAGSATISATSEGKTGTSTITVTAVPVASVVVTPASVSLSVSATQQLSAVTKDSAGNVLTGRTVTWSSSAPAVASVSASGLVTALAAGPATMTATSEGKSGSAAVTVTDSPPPQRVGRYVAPTGTSGGDGTAARPWDLATALDGAGGRILPGDTVWLRGGRYAGTFTARLNGTAAAPIVVRQYPGERATIDGGTTQNSLLTVDGSYAIYWGFEIMSSGTQRFGLAGTGNPLRGTGIYVRNASNVKLVNLILHDIGHGTYTENAAHNIELYGWIVYNGGNEDGNRSDGHGIYIKGDGIGWKVARDNVIFNQFGFGIHGYAESGTTLKNLVLDGNVVFNSGTPSSFDNPNLQLGGTTIADNDTVTNNMVYFSPGVSSSNGNVRIGYNSTLNGTGVFRDNYVVGGTRALDVGYWSNLTVQSNTVVAPAMAVIQRDGASASRQQWAGNMHYRDPGVQAWQFAGTNYTFANWQSRSGAADNASAGTPNAPQVFVRPNRYEPGRATVVIYNWTLQSSVSVDLSGVVTVGNRYEVRNVQDIFGPPIMSGTYGGGAIAFPMNGVTPPQPIGGSFQPLLKTGPGFDVFVVTSAP